MRDLERGLLPGRSLVRLVHGTRDCVGGRLAVGLKVGMTHSRTLGHSVVFEQTRKTDLRSYYYKLTLVKVLLTNLRG